MFERVKGNPVTEARFYLRMDDHLLHEDVRVYNLRTLYVLGFLSADLRIVEKLSTFVFVLPTYLALPAHYCQRPQGPASRTTFRSQCHVRGW